MIKVLGGDWGENNAAAIKRSFTGKFESLILTRGIFKSDKMRRDDILSAEIVTEENQKSIAGKLGWGAAGAMALGPLGLLAGVLGGGNKQIMVVAVIFKDGRKKWTPFFGQLGGQFKVDSQCLIMPPASDCRPPSVSCHLPSSSAGARGCNIPSSSR